ncbi:MAG: fibronectin type III domain-containing protein [Patescibacteria group bacterium]|nr:fibronectin type III domain-containing protein [Patescibacteria group bacterium]
MKKILKVLILVLIGFSFFPALARAADLNIDCNSSDCTKTGLEPIFSTALDGVWHPGRIITKTINLKNSGADTSEMAIKGTRVGEAGALEQVMNVSLSAPEGPVIWAGSLADFYAQDVIRMGVFEPGKDLDYNFTVGMDYGAGNDYQNLQATMDLSVGFWTEPPSSPTPSPASTSNGNGSRDVLGAGVSAPSCNDAKPATPNLLSAVVTGPNQVTLNWSKADGSVSYYLVAYGLESGKMLYGNPNVGGADTTSYTVNDLSGGTTYYFKVRAGNGCTPGELSNELSATPGGQAVTGTPAGFLPGVLGVTNEEAVPSSEPESSQSGILGAETSPKPKEAVIVGGFMGKLGWFVLGPVALFVFLFGRKLLGKRFPF